MASSGQEWQYDISTVRPHIGRSTGRPTPQYWHLVVKNGNMRFQLLELILADQLGSTVISHIGRSSARSTPLVASSSQEWQFHNSTVRAHIGRSPGRPKPPTGI